MQYVYSVLLMIISLVLGFVIRDKMEGGKIFEYFATPGREKHVELDWGLKQFFELFSEKMGQRWYEARAHLYQGVFISLLSAFHLIHIVRIEYQTTREDYTSYVIVKTHGFQSLKTLKKKLPKWTKEKKSQAKDADYWYQTFVSGHNVISDFMNGDFA